MIKLKTAVFSLGLLLAIGSYGSTGGEKDDAQASRTLSESFSVIQGSNLEVMNKYGQVVINTWDNDSIRLEIEITAFGKNTIDARKTLDRVDIDFRQSGNYLTVESTFDKNTNYLKEFWKVIEDESRALFSKSKIEINYKIFIPKRVNITLDNRFGDVYLQDFDGTARITVNHGNLRANNFTSNAIIEVGFGDMEAKSIKSGKLTLKAGKADIEKMGAVTITSSSSEITIGEASRVRIDSRNDKLIRLESVEYLSGKGLFSNFHIYTLKKSLETTMNYGDIRVENIAFNFSNIDLDVTSTDLDLNISAKAFMTVNIEAKEESLFLPTGFLELEKEILDPKKKEIKLSGKVGIPNNYPANLSIKAKGGDVSISLIDGQQSANK
ncbi:MAG: hypothetical protein OEY34_00635 [Cyclobacteriaceae bacterium]|nr:hypothetical protein [Cyclobacteriaceae bacterium]